MDGTVYPSYLRVNESHSAPFASRTFSNLALRPGEVIDVLYPDDPRNRTTEPKQIQYVVRCDHRDGIGQLVTDDYVCTVGNLFGGVSDKLRYTFRRRTEGPTSDDVETVGSRVLVLCMNGHKGNAVIIGGFNHPGGDEDASSTDGHHLDFEFNGVNVQIDKDGALTVVVPGATQADGTPDTDRDANNRGSSISLLKNGTVRVSDNQGEKIEIDTTTRQINFTSKAGTTSTEESWTLTAGSDIKLAAGKTAALTASGSTRLDGGTVYIGSLNSSENLVLGQQLQAALSDLVSSVFQANVASWSSLGPMPLPLHPAVAAAISVWAARWLSGAMLAHNKFTEK